MIRGGRARLVGRFGARQVIAERLDWLRSNRPSLVLIDGPAGIGKSTVALWAVATAVGRGATTLQARCVEGSTVPYGPIADALHSVLGIDQEQPESGTSPEVELFTKVCDRLATVAASAPVMVFVDDLQWADPATLGLFEQIVFALASRSLAGHSPPVLVVAAVRTPVVDERARQTVTRLSKLPIAETVTLEPLDEREGTALLGERRPGTSRAEASRCWRGSGGNPLLMLALLGGAPGSPNGNHARLDDALARRDGLDTGPDFQHDAGALVAKQVGYVRVFPLGPVDLVQLRVLHAALGAALGHPSRQPSPARPRAEAGALRRQRLARRTEVCRLPHRPADG